MINQYETTLSKHVSYGWNVETQVKNINEYDWQISTLKRYDGYITCIAQAGEILEFGFSFAICEDPSVKLYQAKERANRNSA